MDASLSFWAEVKTIIEQVCDKFDTAWQKRKRLLDTRLLVAFIFKLVLSKRQQGYNSNLMEFWEACTEKGIRLPKVTAVAASSLCEARQKLSETIFEELNRALLCHWQSQQDLPTWKGHRLFAVDGSRINLPCELINEGYRLYDKQRRHYPQGLLSCLYNLQEKVVYDFTFTAHIEERLCALGHMKQLASGDVVVFDRGYFSYLLLYHVLEQGLHAIFRLQEGTANKKILDFWQSQQEDAVIEYYPSPPVISDLKRRGFYLDIKPLTLRLIKHKLDNETYVYGTTLLGVDYPKSCFADVYHGRWGIEKLYKISKQIINIEDFHAKTARGVKQELYAHLLLINLARFLAFEAQSHLPSSQETASAVKDSVEINPFNPTNLLSINFKNCLLSVGRQVGNLILTGTELLKDWLPKLISAVARVRQKIRPDRRYPRISYKPGNKWSNWRNLKELEA